MPNRNRTLTAKEKQTLAACLLDSRSSSTVIATRSRQRIHVVRRNLDLLRSKKAIHSALVLNPHAIGMNDFCVFFNCSGNSINARQALIKYCIASPLVSYFAELAGEYQFSVSIFSHSAFEVEKFIERISSTLKDNSFSIHLAVRSMWNILIPGYINKDTGNALQRAEVSEIHHIDDLDQKVINYFSRNPSQSCLFAAKDLKVSEGTVRNRLNKLLETKVITGFPYFLNPKACGLSAFRVLINAKGQRSQAKKSLEEFVDKNLRVSGFVSCLGGWDFEINFEVEDPSEVGEFVQSLYNKAGQWIHSIKTLSELKIHKMPMANLNLSF